MNNSKQFLPRRDTAPRGPQGAQGPGAPCALGARGAGASSNSESGSRLEKSPPGVWTHKTDLMQ